jgi:hypothetical protein
VDASGETDSCAHAPEAPGPHRGLPYN